MRRYRVQVNVKGKVMGGTKYKYKLVTVDLPIIDKKSIIDKK